MLEHILENTRLWNYDIILGNFGMRISASNKLNSKWLENRIKNLSEYEGVYYEKLIHPQKKSADLYKRIGQKVGINSKPFEVPILRLKGTNPKKKVLLQAIHAREWAASESILNFVEKWGRNKIPEKIKEQYEITIIPLLSIDKFPRHYGSMNQYSDIRFETITSELNSADMVIELHESPMKNQSIIFKPLVYGLSGLGLAGSCLELKKEKREKIQGEIFSQLKEFKTSCSSDVEIMYSNDKGQIEKIVSQLSSLKIETEESALSYSRSKATRKGVQTYGIELFSDHGEIGEPFLLAFTAMIAYPITEISTFLNRTFRKKQINQSRLQSAKNGAKVIQSILYSNL